MRLLQAIIRRDFIFMLVISWFLPACLPNGTKKDNTVAAAAAPEEKNQQDATTGISFDQSLDLLQREVSSLTPEPTAAGSHQATPLLNDEEIQLEKAFFKSFNRSEYTAIPGLKAKFEEYLARNPNSGFALSRMGYLNLWFWQERYRQKSIKASGTPIADCYKYFDAAFKIFPNNMVHRGFGSNCLMLAAELDGNDSLMAKATVEATRALSGLKEYAPFSLGYPFTLSETKEKRFRIGLEMLFKILDVCVGQEVNRQRPSLKGIEKLSEVRTTAYSYYCRNTVMAPHIAEGLLLAIGDALLKDKQFDAAKLMYENIRISEGYSSWPFTGALDFRLANLESLANDFNKPTPPYEAPDYQVMTATGPFACGLCHLASAEELLTIDKALETAVIAKGTLSGTLLKP